MSGWLLVVSVIILSLVIAVIAARNNERDVDSNQRAEAARVAFALDAVSSLSVAQLRAAAAFVELHPDLGRTRFRRLVATVHSEQPIAAVSYLEAEPRVNASQGIALQDESHVFRVRHSALDTGVGRLAPADSSSAAHIVEVLKQALESGAPAATRAVRLRDGERDQHLVIFHPVGRNATPIVNSTPDRRISGFIAGVIRVSDLLATADAIVPAGTDVALVEEKGDQVLSLDDLPLEDYASTPVEIAGRGWELRLTVPVRATSSLPLILGLGGLGLAASIGVLLLNWTRRERHALELARTRLEERDRAMGAEAETNRMYRLLAENLTDMVMVTDPDARITYVSPAGQLMTGWTAEEMVGRFVPEFLHGDDEADARLNLLGLTESAGVLTFEHRLRKKDGSHIWVESAVRSVIDPETQKVVEIQATTRDISVRKPMQDRLEQLAREDSLTGLSNRRQFSEILAIELARTARAGSHGSLLMIDIDRFKSVNDSFGHLTGDRVLRRVAELMKARIRVSDTLARFGGDEFAAILPEAGEEEGLTVAEAITDSIRDTFATEPDLPHVTVSVGVTTFEGGDELSPEEVIQRADFAMYRAKSTGRDRALVYRPDEGAAVESGRS